MYLYEQAGPRYKHNDPPRDSTGRVRQDTTEKKIKYILERTSGKKWSEEARNKN